MDLVKFYTAELQKSGRDPKDFLAHEEARPDVVELSAIARSLILSDLTGCRINITHLSSKKGLEMIVDAKRKGSKITCEVGPSWYTFSTDDYQNMAERSASFLQSIIRRTGMPCGRAL